MLAAALRRAGLSSAPQDHDKARRLGADRPAEPL